MGEVTIGAMTLALAYSGQRQAELEKEVECLQKILEVFLKMDQQKVFKASTAQQKDLMEDFRKSLTTLAVFRTKLKQKRKKTAP